MNSYEHFYEVFSTKWEGFLSSHPPSARLITRGISWNTRARVFSRLKYATRPNRPPLPRRERLNDRERVRKINVMC